MDKDDDLVSLPLQILVKDLLGSNHYVPISKITAEMILYKTKNQKVCHIQYPSSQDVDIVGRILTTPLLWDLTAWRNSSERRAKAQIRSQQQRDEKFVYDGNIRLIKNNIIRNFELKEEIANVLARIAIDKKDYNRIKAYGVKKLYTHVKELP